MKLKLTLFLSFFAVIFSVNAQETEKFKATSYGMLQDPISVPSIADQIKNGTFIYQKDSKQKEARPKRQGANQIVPGKGSDVNDPLVGLQRNNTVQHRAQPPILTFTANTAPVGLGVTDPTGAAGPNHYVAAWNFGFRIFDKSGNPLTPAAALSSLFPGNNIGDPIIFFDADVDNGPGEPKGRFVITEFANNPNGFDIAVCQGPDPVNDGWHVYSGQFETGQFPDYTKFSVHGDKYFVTANINGVTNRVFAVERNEMLNGDPAQFVGLPLPGLVSSGFYSPQAFHTTNDVSAPIDSPASIVYMQDDAWAGVTNDHLKVWQADVDWTDPAGATMSAPQEIGLADGVNVFTSVFDGGSFSNRPQGGGVDIDVLQATIMNQAQYRRFPTYNSAIFNFVVDVVAGSGEKAAVRWYELRQTTDGEPWTVFQEGTYEAPGGRDAYSASMVMNDNGDIAMGYTSSSETERISIRYTGRFSGDPLNVMTVNEELIGQSIAANQSNRLADYVQLSIDPVDQSFWHIAEYFNPQKMDIVGNFVISPPVPDDIGVTAITSPVSGVLGTDEAITITIRNFGSNDITNPMVQYEVNGMGAVVETTDVGLIAPGAEVDYTFDALFDFSTEGDYTIVAKTNLAGDSNVNNDEFTLIITSGAMLCTPTATTGCNIDGIKMFVLNTITADDGGDGCNTEPASSPQGYSDRTDLSTILSNVDGQNVYTLQAQQNWNGGVGVEALSVWVDFNDDLNFDASEQLISGEFFTAFGQLEDFTLTIPVNAALGPHVLRAKAIDTSAGGDIDDPCTDFDFGEVQDYTVDIQAVLSVEETAIANADFQIITKPNNQFDIKLTTEFDGVASIAIYDVTGRIIAFNNLFKTADSYNYELDMSYSPSGIYFVRMGDQATNTFKTGKIIVK